MTPSSLYSIYATLLCLGTVGVTLLGTRWLLPSNPKPPRPSKSSPCPPELPRPSSPCTVCRWDKIMHREMELVFTQSGAKMSFLISQCQLHCSVCGGNIRVK